MLVGQSAVDAAEAGVRAVELDNQEQYYGNVFAITVASVGSGRAEGGGCFPFPSFLRATLQFWEQPRRDSYVVKGSTRETLPLHGSRHGPLCGLASHWNCVLLHEFCAVGYGGLPNSQGWMEMDAAIMDGGASLESTASAHQSPANRLGAVCALAEQMR